MKPKPNDQTFKKLNTNLNDTKYNLVYRVGQRGITLQISVKSREHLSRLHQPLTGEKRAILGDEVRQHIQDANWRPIERSGRVRNGNAGT